MRSAASSSPPRVVIADDSATARALLRSILTDTGAFDVVGEASTSEAALALVHRLRPDAITVDLEMPDWDGLELTRRIMEQAPTPVAVVSGHVRRDDMRRCASALAAGALAVLQKPEGPGSPEFDRTRSELLGSLASLVQLRLRRPKAPPERRARLASDTFSPTNVDVIAVLASTGGPSVLRRLIAAVSPRTPPMLVVQHMAPGFIGALAEAFDRQVACSVGVAEQGQSLRPGHVYLAPDGAHLGVSRAATVTLSRTDAVRGFRPAGTELFRSVARAFGARSLAMALTGMGEDGLEGLRDVKEAGGAIVAQDEASCVVYGIPRAVVESGLAAATLSTTELESLIRTTSGGAR